jgi:hypothetical protein
MGLPSAETGCLRTDPGRSFGDTKRGDANQGDWQTNALAQLEVQRKVASLPKLSTCGAKAGLVARCQQNRAAMKIWRSDCCSLLGHSAKTLPVELLGRTDRRSRGQMAAMWSNAQPRLRMTETAVAHIKGQDFGLKLQAWN